jgi:IstB-like ATP binding protein
MGDELSVGTGVAIERLITVGIARACIRGGARGRFFNVVDLVNKLEAEARAGRQGRLADHLCRMNLVVLDELGYLPSPRPAASCSSTWSAGSTSRPRSSSPRTWPSENGLPCSATRR